MRRAKRLMTLVIGLLVLVGWTAPGALADHLNGEYRYRIGTAGYYDGNYVLGDDRGTLTLDGRVLTGESRGLDGAVETFDITLDEPIREGRRRQHLCGEGTFVLRDSAGRVTRGVATVTGVLKQRRNGKIVLGATFIAEATRGYDRRAIFVGAVVARPR